MATTTMSTQTGQRMQPMKQMMQSKTGTTSLILGASLASVVLSLLTVRKSPSVANFFGLWAPTILGIGIMLKENQIQEQLES